MGFGSGGHVITVRHPFFVNFQIVSRHAFNVGLSALLCDHGMPGTADHGDLTVAEGDQMFNGVVDAFKAVGADIADIGIFAYVIIEKSRRYRGGLKLLHPCVLQSKSYDESADVAVFQHVGIIFLRSLEGGRDRYDRNVVISGISGLLEPEDDIIAELLDSLIVHVFDEDTKSLVFFGTHLSGHITQFYGSIKYGLTELFADVAGAV